MVKLNRRAAAALAALLMAAPVLTIGVVGQAQEGGACNRHSRPHDAIAERGGVSRCDQIFIHRVRRHAGPARWK